MRKLLAGVVLLVVLGAGVWVWAGRLPGPALTFEKPERFAGVTTPIALTIDVPRDRLESVSLVFEQNGKQTPIYALTGDPTGGQLADVSPGRVRLALTIGRDSVPGLSSGPAKIIATASRRVLGGLRSVGSEAAREVQVRLESPRLAVVSLHHYINLGGSEAVIYRVTPADVRSGVNVGGIEYPGFPASGAKVAGTSVADPALRIAFFALRYDQALTTPIALFARDEAGNAATARFDYRTFPKPFKQSRIPLDDTFLGRVVPAILAGTSEVKPAGSLLDQFLVVNRDLRQKNADTIASFAATTSPEMLWAGQVFHAFANTTAESAFADRRTYIYQGREVDQQTHLGFDLASFAGTSIVAANRGTVVFAAELGIYGNCVIIDHGMGVQSLYGHLSQIGVRPGVMVEKGHEIGKSGMTGMAGGDHLHFTMLVNGQMVNPIEWWDEHWIQDRVVRKLRDATAQ